MSKKRKSPRRMERHHRLPRSRGGRSSPDNIVVVDRDDHRAWHRLVGNMDAEEVASMLTDTWIDPDYYLVAIPRHKSAPRKKRTRVYCTTCECEVLQHIPKTNKRRRHAQREKCKT